MHNATKEQLIAFEQRIAGIFAEGELPFLIHLSGGNEDRLIRIFSSVKEGDWICSSHRNHYHALLAGMPPDELEAKIRRGDSMFVYSKRLNFLSSAILGGMCGIAAGLAWQLEQEKSLSKVWCFLGDGACDNGHIWEAVNFVHGHNLPCTFVIENNNRSVDATIIERRGPHGHEFDPLIQFRCVFSYDYTPTWPHGGAGLKTMVTFKPEAIQRYLEDKR